MYSFVILLRGWQASRQAVRLLKKNSGAQLVMPLAVSHATTQAAAPAKNVSVIRAANKVQKESCPSYFGSHAGAPLCSYKRLRPCIGCPARALALFLT